MEWNDVRSLVKSLLEDAEITLSGDEKDDLSETLLVFLETLSGEAQAEVTSAISRFAFRPGPAHWLGWHGLRIR
jgi:hypothetical protein